MLHIVGAARDERGGREALDFSVRERQHALEQAASQAGADFCRRATRDETHDYGDDHAERGEAEHFAARGEQVIHLHGVQVVTELLILGLGGGNRLLAHDGIGHVAHLRLRFIEHGLNVRFLHHAGVVSGFQLVKVHAGLVGVMHRNKRHRHGIVELRTMLAAEVGELVGAVGLLGVGIGEQAFVLLAFHNGDQVVRALGERIGRRMLDARLLNAHVNDVRCVVRQRQVAERLNREQHHDDRYRDFMIRKILD